jgi:hypothetical protein
MTSAGAPPTTRQVTGLRSRVPFVVTTVRIALALIALHPPRPTALAIAAAASTFVGVTAAVDAGRSQGDPRGGRLAARAP